MACALPQNTPNDIGTKFRKSGHFAPRELESSVGVLMDGPPWRWSP